MAHGERGKSPDRPGYAAVDKPQHACPLHAQLQVRQTRSSRRCLGQADEIGSEVGSWERLSKNDADRELVYNDELTAKQWALNSAVECHPHTVEVVGSNPTALTNLICLPHSRLRGAAVFLPS